MDKKHYDEGTKLAEDVSYAFNLRPHQARLKGLLDRLSKDHRSLQYEEIKFAAYYLHIMSQAGTDERNARAVRLAQVIDKAVKAEYGDDVFDSERFWIG